MRLYVLHNLVTLPSLVVPRGRVLEVVPLSIEWSQQELPGNRWHPVVNYICTDALPCFDMSSIRIVQYD